MYIVFSSSFILDKIEFILENNNICFDDIHFKQIEGTAMGTKFTPIYTRLKIGYLKEIVYIEIKNTFGTDFGNYFENNGSGFLMDKLCPRIKNITWNSR